MRSAAALAQANNDLDKSIALVTAANNVVQDPQVVGTALRTVSMRIRAAKKELTELGEDTDGLADSVSSLREEVLALSGVDIMIDNNTFKDTYDIMLELSRVWDKLSDVSQAALLERIAGKRGANAVASILSNVQDLEAALVTAQNATGSAAAENAKYLESIQGRISQLKASWQEFWDASPIQDVSKAVISAADAFVQLLNAAGGLNSVLMFAFSSALLMNIEKITGKAIKFSESISGVRKTLTGLREAMRTSGISNGRFAFDAFFGRSSFSNNQTGDAASSIAKAFNSALKSSGGDGLAAQAAAMQKLKESQTILNASTQERIRLEIEKAAATGKSINADKLSAQTTALVTREQAAGTKQAQAYAAAQQVVGAALRMGVALAITLAINAFREYRQEQERLKQIARDNADAQIQYAKSLREAVQNLGKVRNEFKSGSASADDYRSAIDRVTQALGDQQYVLAGLDKDSEEYWNRVRQIMYEQDEEARTAANISLQQSSEKQLTNAAKKRAGKRAAVGGGVGLGLGAAGVAAAGLTGPIGWAAVGITAAAAAAVSYFSSVGTEAQKASEHIEEYAKKKRLIESLEDSLKDLEERRETIYDPNDPILGTLDKQIANTRVEIGKLYKELGEFENVDTIINDAIESISLEKFAYSDNIVDLYDGLDAAIWGVIESANLGADAYDLILNKLASTKQFGEAIAAWKNADKAIEHFGITGTNTRELLEKFTPQDLYELNSVSFKDYVEEQKIAILSTQQLIDTFDAWKTVQKESARETNTLTSVIRANKEAIDSTQEAIAKLGAIFKADYSNNASGMIDDMQALIDILSSLDARDAEKFFNQLNNAFSMDAIDGVLKDISEDLMDLQIDKLVEQLNLANPALEETFKAMVKQEKQIETLTAGLDSFKSGYQSLIGVVKDYNENGFLTADNIASILDMSPEYLSALEVEGDKLRLNKDALKDIVIAKLEEAKQQVELTYQTKLAAIAAEQEARTKKAATEWTYEHTEAMLREAIAANASEATIRSLEKSLAELQQREQQLSGKGVDTSGFDEIARKQEEEARKQRDLANQALDHAIQSANEGKWHVVDTFMGIADEAKDAANELKSQIDSVLSKWKSALDSGAINYKQYLDKMKAMRDKYADQLSQEDLLQMDVDIAQTELDMWKEAGDALGRQIDRTMIKPLQDRIEGLNEEREALQKNKEATSAYYDEIIGGLEDQKQAIDDNIKAIEKSYDAQIKPLEAQQKAINKQIKAIEKEKRVIEDQIKVLERSKRPYEQQQKAIQKEIRAIEKEIKVLEKSKKPYEQKQKAIEKEIKAIEREVRALERTKKPYEQQQKIIEKEIKAIEKQIKALEKTKKPYEDQKKAIDKQVKAIQNQIKAIEDSKRPYEDQQKAINKQIKAIQKQVKELEKSKKPYEQQQRAIDKQSKAIQKQIKALEKTKKPYEEQQKAIDKEIKAIQKQIKAIQDTEKPYKEEQKYLQQSIRAIEEKIKSFEKLQKPYKDQLTLINNEIAAIEREIELMNRTKRPFEERQQAIQNEIAALEYQTEVIERQENVYKREQDAIDKDIELIERQVAALEHRKKPYEIAQRQISRQIDLLQQEQKELEKLKKPYEDEIKLLEEELEAMQKANEERQAALELQQAEYNLRRAQQQRVNYVYQDGQFQYVADQGAIKDAQKAIDDLKYEESVKRVQNAIDALRDKIDEITAQSELIQEDIDELTEKNDQLSESIQRIQDEIDPLQDEIDELSYYAEELQWSINDIEYSMMSLRYAIEDLEITNADLSESIRQIDEAIQPLENRLNSLKDTAADLQWEIDLIQQNIDPLNDQIQGLNDRIQELQLVIDSIEESIEPLNERIDELTERNELLQESIDAITESIEPLQEQIDELSEQSEAVQEIIDGITEAIEPLNDEIDALTDRNEEIQEIIDEIGESIDGLNRQIDDLNAQGDAIQEMIDQIDEAIYPLEEHIDSLNEKNEELQEHIDAIDEAIAPLQERIDELGYQSEELQDAIDAIDEAIEPLQAHIEDLNEQNDELQEHIDAINDEIEELNYQLEPLNDQIEELNRQNEDLSEAIEILREQQALEVEALQAQSDAIQEQIDYYNTLKTQAEESIQAQIDKIDEHIELLEQEVKGIEEYKNKLTEIFDEIDARKDEDLLTTLFGEGWQEKLKSLDPSIIEAFATGYEGATDRLRLANEAVINSLDGEEGIEGAASRAETEVTELKDAMEQGEAAMGSGSLKDAMDQTGSSALIMAGNFDTAKESWDRFYEAVRIDSIDIQGFLDVHVFQWVSKIREEMDKLPAAMDFFKRSVVDENGPQIVLQFEAINEQILTVKKTIEEDIPNALRFLDEYIKKDFAESVKGTSEGIKQEVIQDADGIVDHIKTRVVPELQKASDDVKEAIEEDVNYLVDVKFPRAKDGILRIAEETKDGITTKVDELVKYIEGAVDDVVDYIEGHNGKERILRVVQDLIDDINETIDTFVNEDLPKHLAEVENKVNGSVTNICNALDPIGEKVDSIKGHVQATVVAMDNLAQSTWNVHEPASGLKDIFSNMSGDVVEAAKNINESLIPALEKASQLSISTPGQVENNQNAENAEQNTAPYNVRTNYSQSNKNNNSGQLFSSKGDDSKSTPYKGIKTINIYMYGEGAAYERAEKYRAQGYDVHITRGKEYVETLSRHARGGVVTDKTHSSLDSIAKRIGEDQMIAVKNGERILTSRQNKDFEKLVNLAPKLVKHLQDIQNSASNIGANINVGADNSDALAKISELERKVQDAKYLIGNEVDSVNDSVKYNVDDAIGYIEGSDGLEKAIAAVENTRNMIAGEGGMLDEMSEWINQDVEGIVGEEGLVPLATQAVKTNVEETINEIAGEEGMLDRMVSMINDDMNMIVGEEGIVPVGLETAKVMVEEATNHIAGEGGLMDLLVENIRADVDEITGEAGIVPQGALAAIETVESAANIIAIGDESILGQMVVNIGEKVDSTIELIRYGTEEAERIVTESIDRIMNNLLLVEDTLSGFKWHIEEAANALGGFSDSLSNAIGPAQELREVFWNMEGAAKEIDATLGNILSKLSQMPDSNGFSLDGGNGSGSGNGWNSNGNSAGFNRTGTSSNRSGNRSNGVGNANRGGNSLNPSGSIAPSASNRAKTANRNSGLSSALSKLAGNKSSGFNGSNGSSGLRDRARAAGISDAIDDNSVKDASNNTTRNLKDGAANSTISNILKISKKADGESAGYGFDFEDLKNRGLSVSALKRTILAADQEMIKQTKKSQINNPSVGWKDGNKFVKTWQETSTHQKMQDALNYLNGYSDNYVFKKKKGFVSAIKDAAKTIFALSGGGVIPNDVIENAFDVVAKSVGEDKMVAVKEGERILTPKQNKDFEEFVKLTPELINATESLAKYAKLFADISTLDSMASENGVARGVNGVVDRANGAAVTANSVSLTIGDIHVHEVDNADDLAKQIKNNLPNSLLQALGRAS